MNTGMFVVVVLAIGYFYVTVKEIEEKMANSRIGLEAIIREDVGKPSCRRISDQDRRWLDREILNNIRLP